MKYYIRAINTETGQRMIIRTAVFTSRKKAEEFAEKFMELMTPVAKLEIVEERR